MRPVLEALAVVSIAALAAPALAQDAPAPAAPAPDSAPGGASAGDGSAAPAGGGPGVVYVPGPTQTTTTVYPGALPPPGFDPNAHLPSSSRAVTDINQGDTFDLAPNGSGAASVHGDANGSYVVEGQVVPEAHSVRRGDTLWDLSAQYYHNPYAWPRLWAQNPQIQNPHWIYPGDRVRLRDSGAAGDTASRGGGIGLNRRHASVPPETIFLREVGWVDDPKKDAWGELVGSESDHMLLSEGSDVYVKLEDDHDVSIGQELTLFLPLREVESEDNDDVNGSLVSVRGTARVDRYNPKTHMARARVVEALDVIERGCKVGPVGRRFHVVPPKRNEQDVEARILASIYPYRFWGQNQVVFIDKGEKEGVEPGNRFFAVMRADRWRRSFDTIGPMGKLRPMVEDDRAARVQSMDAHVDEDAFPDETYAELRVVTVRDHTAMAIVTASTHEIERGARLVARKGY